jgi:hypothetical protein
MHHIYLIVRSIKNEQNESLGYQLSTRGVFRVRKSATDRPEGVLRVFGVRIQEG